MPIETITVGIKHDTSNMRHYRALFVISVLLLQSCSNVKQTELKNPYTEYFLSEMALGYWDFNYTFPASYLQSRDTDAYFFPQYTTTDSILLCYASEIMYTDQDTILLITYRNDTLAQVSLPCSCDWTDDIPCGPRAYDSLNNLILDDFIQVSWHGDQMRLTQDLVSVLLPDIEKRMNEKGYVKVGDDNKEYPQYLLIEYLPKNDSIHLIKACHKYSCYFYDEYAKILRIVFSEYCRNNHVARLLTAVEIYLPSTKNTKPVVDN